MTTALLEKERPASVTKRRILISTDAHAGIPDDELRSRLPENLRDKMPELSELAEAMKRDPKLVERLMKMGGKKRPELLPADRIREQEIDGVVAEVVYGSVGVGKVDNLKFSVARAKATNDWYADLYGGYLNRFAPAAVSPLAVSPGMAAPEPEYIQATCEEIRRVRKLGLRPFMLPDHCDSMPYNQPDWDPIWEAACEVDMPLAFHVGFGSRRPQKHKNPGGALVNYCLVTTSIVETPALLASAGVYERFPSLKTCFVECGAGWLAFAMMILDEAYYKHEHWAKPKLKMPPSEYMKRQVKVTFQDDPVGVQLRHRTGLDCLMWGSDYPHHEGTWPNSQEAVEKMFKGVPEDEIDQMVRRNAEKFFEFDLRGISV